VDTSRSYLTFGSGENLHLPLKIRIAMPNSIYCSSACSGLKSVTVVLLSSLIVMCDVQCILCRHRVKVLGKVFSKKKLYVFTTKEVFLVMKIKISVLTLKPFPCLILVSVLKVK